MIEAALKEILSKSIDCQELIVENQSHLHEGHAGSPGTGQSHFHVKIVSKDLQGMSKLEQHRHVNNMVKSLFDKGLHALTLDLSSI